MEAFRILGTYILLIISGVGLSIAILEVIWKAGSPATADEVKRILRGLAAASLACWIAFFLSTSAQNELITAYFLIYVPCLVALLAITQRKVSNLKKEKDPYE